MDNPSEKTGRKSLARKGALAGFSFLAGLLSASMGWGKYNLLIILLIIAVSPPVIYIFRRYRKAILLCVICAVLGIADNSFFTITNYNKITALDGKNITVEGYIKDYEYTGSETCLLTVKGHLDGVKGTIRFYAPYGDFDYFDKIKARVKVEKITDTVNFSGESYNRPDGIFIQGEEATEYSIGRNANPVFREIAHYRDYCQGQIKVKCGRKESDFLCAMLCGDKSELSQADKTRSYRCGIGHLLAVSGAHLVILAELISVFLRVIKNKRIRFLVTVIMVWAFAVFSGLSVSVIRAAVMVTILRSAFIFGRRGDALNSLGICVILLTLANPYSVRSASFLLTVTAAFVMEVILPEFVIQARGFLAKTGNSLISYELIMFCMLPLNLVLFGGVSVISPLTNLIIAPLCTLAMSFGFVFLLSGCAAVAAPFTIFVADKIMNLAVKMIDFSADLPYCYIYGKYRILNFLMISACIYWMTFAFFNKKSRVNVVVFGMIILVTSQIFYSLFNLSGKDRQKKEICVIPGGRGCEYVLNTPDFFVVFDYGAKGKSNSSVVRYMEKYGVENVDYAFLLDGEYDFTQFKNDIYCSPDYVFLDSYGKKDKNVKDFDVGSFFADKNFGVTQGKKGYYVTYSDFNIQLARKYFVIDGKKYKITNDMGAFIVDMDSKKVRRTDCGFD